MAFNVAVSGPTGAGKSTLISAVLGTNAWTVSSDRGACTQVPVYYHHHCSEEAVARVTYIDAEAIRAMLHVDLEVLQIVSCKEFEDELKLLYAMYNTPPYVKPPQRVSQYLVDRFGSVEVDDAVDQIIADARLPTSETVDIPGAKRWRDVDAFVSPRDQPCGWPMVRKVDIFAASFDVLDRGIVLVDTPGTADQDRARAGRAKTVRAHYAIAVLPCMRAASSSAALEIIRNIAGSRTADSMEVSATCVLSCEVFPARCPLSDQDETTTTATLHQTFTQVIEDNIDSRPR